MIFAMQRKFGSPHAQRSHKLDTLDLWAQQQETELLKQARVMKHQAKKITVTRVKHGAIKCVELEKENGVLIWSVDIAQPQRKTLPTFG